MLALCGVPLAAAAPGSDDAAVMAVQVSDADAGTAFVEGEVLVTFKGEASAQEATEAVVQAETIAPFEVTEAEVAEATPVLVKVAPEASVSQAVAELAEDPAVESVQPNYIYRLVDDEAGVAGAGASGGSAFGGSGSIDALEPDAALLAENADAALGAQATVNDYYRSYQWYLDSINAYSAWDIAKAEGAVTVAVIDSGIDMDHPDLVNNIVAPRDFVNLDDSPDDEMGHGTHVAGIVAAQSNNGIGTSGVSYNAKVMPLGVFEEVYNESKKETEWQTNSSIIVDAYNYFLRDTDSNGKGDLAEQYNLKVINMSLGGEGSLSSDSVFANCIDRAAAQGIITVCAAGNENSDKPYLPADYETCVSVIALKNDGTSKADFSNYGNDKDISAPGSSIFSTVNGGDWDYMSGTSMASPVVAGVAALLYAYDSSLTVDEVKNALYSTATNLGSSYYFGAGRVNAYAALESLVPDEPEPTTTITSTNISVASSLFTNTQISPAVTLGTTALTEGIDYSVVYQNAAGNTVAAADLKSPGIYSAQISGMGIYDGVGTANFTIYKPTLNYDCHVQDIGWMLTVPNGQMAGTSGRSLRMEAVRVYLANDGGLGGIAVRAHVQDYGNMAAVGSGQLCGTSGQSKRIEAMSITLGTAMKVAGYELYYRVHVQDVGWMGWACDDAQTGEGPWSGTAGLAKRLEAVQILLVAPGETAPDTAYNGVQSATSHSFINPELADGSVAYNAMMHIKNLGNTYYNAATGSFLLGTVGSSRRLEAITLQLSNTTGYSGGVAYKTHVQNIGWEPAWASDGSLSGTCGKALRLEAIQIKLTGALADHYDVYYRTHVQNIGWTGWATNGQSCGSSGYSYRMEAMQVMIVAKTATAPGINSGYMYAR